MVTAALLAWRPPAEDSTATRVLVPSWGSTIDVVQVPSAFTLVLPRDAAPCMIVTRVPPATVAVPEITRAAWLAAPPMPVIVTARSGTVTPGTVPPPLPRPTPATGLVVAGDGLAAAKLFAAASVP